MNIFILDNDPKKAAWYLCDKHVVKMILESAQLLSAGHARETAYNGAGPYKLTHAKHPCTLWVNHSRANYEWLIEHVEEMMRVYEHTYGRKHASGNVIEWCKENLDKLCFSGNTLTDFPLAMPDDCKVGNAVESYREYYRKHKKQFAKWKNRKVPEWF